MASQAFHGFSTRIPCETWGEKPFSCRMATCREELYEAARAALVATLRLATSSLSPYQRTRYSHGYISLAATSFMSRSFSASVPWMMLSSNTTSSSPSSKTAIPIVPAHANTAREKS